jgi:ferredoxin/GNAT superfamily N-acetyltransferase
MMEKNEKHRIELITKKNIRKAIEIRAHSYVKDYQNILPDENIDQYDFESDLNEIATWLFEITEDFRMGYLYYIDQTPVGAAIASMAEIEGHLNDVELNYLFVSEKARGFQVGKKLMQAIAAKYSEIGVSGLLLYNWRLLKSNEFYRHLGGTIIETSIQTPGGKPLETDIFYWPLSDLLALSPISKIVWFSGTGGVEHVSKKLSEKLLQQGNINISMKMSECLNGHYLKTMESAPIVADFLFVLYPVHAFDAPEIVYKWLQTLPEGNGTRAVVISVSGGGEMWPNTSCRRKTIQLLIEKGYAVIYERMFVMPSNMLVETEPDLVSHIMRTLPLKIQDLLKDLNNGVVRRDRVKLSSIWLEPISRWERKVVKRGSKLFVVNDQCSRCGCCVDLCPMDNIKLESSEKPVFGDECLLCLKCYYTCPQKAIEAPTMKKWLLKAYNIEKLIKLGEQIPSKTEEECCKGLIWIGVKRYLMRIKY